MFTSYNYNQFHVRMAFSTKGSPIFLAEWLLHNDAVAQEECDWLFPTSAITSWDSICTDSNYISINCPVYLSIWGRDLACSKLPLCSCEQNSLS